MENLSQVDKSLVKGISFFHSTYYLFPLSPKTIKYFILFLFHSQNHLFLFYTKLLSSSLVLLIKAMTKSEILADYL